MATLAVGSDPGTDKSNSITGAKKEEINQCDEITYKYIESFKSEKKSAIWNEIVKVIYKYIDVENLVNQKNAIEKNMLDDINMYYESYMNISKELDLINCLRTDIKDVLEQPLNQEITYFLQRKSQISVEEDGCYRKYPVIGWYLYKQYYITAQKDEREQFLLLPEPNNGEMNFMKEPFDLIAYIRNKKWELMEVDYEMPMLRELRSTSVANLKDVEGWTKDDWDKKPYGKPPTPTVGPAPHLFRKEDFEGLPKLEIPQARGWVKNVIKKSETSTPERYAGSRLFTCDICRQEGVKKLKPMTRQALADHIKNKHAYHSPAKKSLVLTSSKPTDELEKMNTGDTNISFPSSSSLGVRDRSPSFSPSISPSMSREPSSDILTLKKMNSNDSLDSITPERGPKGRKVKKRKKMKRQKLRSHSSGDLDEPPITSAVPGMSVKRSTSFESTFGNDNRKVSPKSNDDTGNVFNPLYDTMDLMTNERLRPPTPMFVKDEDEDDKYKKKGGRSKSRRCRKKSTKKKSRRKKRN